MASTSQSPVMVEQPSSPPSRAFTNPDFALSILSPTTSNSRPSPPAATPVPANMPDAEPPQPQEDATVEGEAEDPATTANPTNTNDGDDTSNSESNSDSSTSTETPGTVSTPRSSAQDSGNPVPDSSSTQLNDQPTEQTSDENNTSAADASAPAQPVNAEADQISAELTIPQPPTDIDIPPVDNTPSWVLYDEDTSVPDAEELKTIEAKSNPMDASNPTAVEKEVFTHIDDPDLRPCKKIRLSWVIKGVRGTKERPNRARIMTSPAVCIDGMYWNLKFFPRGNKSRNCLAAYLRCSPTEPLSQTPDLVGSFQAWEGEPDADLAQSSPTVKMELELPEPKEEEEKPEPSQEGEKPTPPVESVENTKSTSQDAPQVQEQEAVESQEPSQNPDGEQTPAQLPEQTVQESAAEHTTAPPDGEQTPVQLPEQTAQESPAEQTAASPDGEQTPVQLPEQTAQENAAEQTTAPTQTDHDDTDSSSDEEDEDAPETPRVVTTQKDFRLSAQLGLAISNPAEPRTCTVSSASHQFCPHQDDWGWDTAVMHWEDIHRRKHGQRQALLRDDTLTVDAYIRIYDDPTKALFWHPSPGESQWDSKGLAGVFPVGTRLLYHSPATAGIIAWTLLAPFRKLVQNIEAGAWRKNSAARPRPLVAHLQLMLFQMRHMKKEELYLRLDNIIHEITRSGESFDNVNTFWEALRRAIEIETEGDGVTKEALCAIFGTREQFGKIPALPVKDVANFQESASAAFEKANWTGSLPNFLPLSLQRQSFDVNKREWQLHNDRVAISEEVDLSRFCEGGDGKYTLYGFIVHDGERTSGKFFSLLRPHGPSGKWLAFSDGNGNKVFSHTKKRIQEYEGLESYELKKPSSPRQTIHSALYVKSSHLSEFLVDEFEPFKLPQWLKPHLDETYYQADGIFEDPEDENKDKPIPVELFWDRSVGGQEGKLDLYKLKSNEKAQQKEHWQAFTADRNATISNIKAKLAEILDVDQNAFKLWAMNHHRLGGVSKGYMYVLLNDSILRACLNTSLHLSLWFTMVPGKYNLEDEVIGQNFMKVSGTHVEAPPQPEPVVEKTEPAGEDAPAATEQTESTETTDNNTAPIPSEIEAAPDAEQASVQAAVEQTLNASSSSQSPAAEQPSQNEAIPEQAVVSTDQVAAPDAEQQAVRDAVEQAIAAAVAAGDVPVTEVREVELANVADLIQQNPSEQSSTQSQADATSEESAPTATISQDESPAPVSSEDLPVTPSEPASIETAINATEIPTETATENDLDLPPVVHGHLFEASTHMAEVLSPTESENGPPLSHGEPPLPVGIPLNVNNEQVVLIQPNADEISAEDAALISSMLAADLEAAEREGRRILTNAAEASVAEAGNANNAAESRPQTPKQVVPDIYGFLHVFDAEKQKFTAHGTFMVPRDTTISSMVRKAMNFEEGKSFQLWKREGTYRTTAVSLETTFQDASLTDCCEVVVGDQLGESKTEALKSEAKYVDPGQLMRYIAMVQRGHPTASLTTSEPVELAEFGADYYRGALVRGQRHGKDCKIITQAGDSFEGPLIAGQKSGGKGKMTYQNGDTYDGEWLDDMKHGQGEFLEKRTGNRYVGGYENDKRWGKGVTYWEQADQQAALCQVCYFEEVDALFYRCGHVVACYSCAKQCATDSNGCPVCRKPIEAVVKMFRS